jgi:adenosylmethionine-8-amino-7-oxononanoate aminotransferase
MSVSERGLFTDAFRDYLFEPIFIDPPSPKNIYALLAIVREQGPDIACIIYEPLLQAAGGMRMYDAASMDLLLEEIKKQDILVIADEVLTGFGRTGKTLRGRISAAKSGHHLPQQRTYRRHDGSRRHRFHRTRVRGLP